MKFISAEKARRRIAEKLSDLDGETLAKLYNLCFGRDANAQYNDNTDEISFESTE